MARRDQKEVAPNPEEACTGQAPKSQDRDRSSQERGEEKGVGKSPVSPEIAVMNAQAKPKDIEVGYNRTEGSRDPYPFRDAGAMKAGSDAQGSDRM